MTSGAGSAGSAGSAGMPGIIYGTAWKKGATADLVALAIEEGFRGIDTACQPKHYNEAGVGEGIARCLGDGLTRGDLYLQTKFSPLDAHDPARIPYDPKAPVGEQVSQSFAQSLANLDTDYLDGLILHSPLATMGDTLEAWRALERVAAEGGTLSLGISNCYSPSLLESLYDAAEVKPAALQNRFYRDTKYDREIRACCRERGIVYQSFWTLTANPHLLAHSAARAIAHQLGRTPAQILFRYLVHEGIVPLTGTTDVTHMREDLAIFEFDLDESDRLTMSRLIG